MNWRFSSEIKKNLIDLMDLDCLGALDLVSKNLITVDHIY